MSDDRNDDLIQWLRSHAEESGYFEEFMDAANGLEQGNEWGQELLTWKQIYRRGGRVVRCTVTPKDSHD